MSMTHETPPPAAPIDTMSDRGDDRRMEKRIEKLETELAAIKLDVGIVKAHGAIKLDIAEIKANVSEAKTTIILWVVTAIVLAQLLPALLKTLT